MADARVLVAEFDQMVDALERSQRSKLRRRFTAGWWALLEAWSWTRWAWTRRPWWMFCGVAHPTPMHDPDHYRGAGLFVDLAAAVNDVYRQIGEAMAESFQHIARAVNDVARAMADWWEGLPPETRAILAAMSEDHRQ